MITAILFRLNPSQRALCMLAVGLLFVAGMLALPVLITLLMPVLIAVGKVALCGLAIALFGFVTYPK